MRATVVFFVLVFVCTVVVADRDDQLFNDWATRTLKNALNDKKPMHNESISDDVRKAAFKANLHDIEEINADQTQEFSADVNSFTGLTDDEKKAYLAPGLLGDLAQRHKRSMGDGPFFNRTLPATVPASLDWRSRGVVSKPKNQQQCGWYSDHPPITPPITSTFLLFSC
jgi:hypothetical protein